MEYKLTFRKFASSDLEGIIEWYGKINPELSTGLLHEVDAAIISIRKNPSQFAVLYKDYSKVNTKRFPYKVIYRLHKDEIIILGIVHHKRHHRVWRRRK
jgi:plasmid stabilization system protein ParE